MTKIKPYFEVLAPDDAGSASQMWPANKVAAIENTQAAYITGSKAGEAGVNPVNTTAPLVSPATIAVGGTVTTTDGVWTGTVPMNFTYQWKAAGVNVASNGTSKSYVPVAGDSGKALTCQVTAVNGMTNTAQLSSNSCAVS
jgi:hypothetical protein